MSNNLKDSSRNSMGILGWLFIILFILKMNPGKHLTTDVVHWSWWWVTSPLWAPMLLAIVIVIVMIISKAFLDAFGKK